MRHPAPGDVPVGAGGVPGQVGHVRGRQILYAGPRQQFFPQVGGRAQRLGELLALHEHRVFQQAQQDIGLFIQQIAQCPQAHLLRLQAVLVARQLVP